MTLNCYVLWSTLHYMGNILMDINWLNCPCCFKLPLMCIDINITTLPVYMITSSHGKIFRVTSHLCGKSPVTGEFHAQRPVTRSFDVFFDLRLNKRLIKQSWGWWFETPLRSLWCHCNENWVANWGLIIMTAILADDTLRCIFSKKMYQVWFKFHWGFREGCNKSALFEVINWHRTSDNPLNQ